MLPSARTESDLRELRVLEEIERNPRVSQRQLANDLGIALGVANACVRTLARKGLVKIRGESNRSITYHLTKQGLTRKAALALEWTNNTIADYVQARGRLGEQLKGIVAKGFSRVVLLGANEASELVALLAPSCGLHVAAIIRTEDAGIAETLVGIPVNSLETTPADGIDAVLVCVDPKPAELPALFARFADTPLLSLTGLPLDAEGVQG
jgi:DNA-binding MarR family transcriptional regulator